MHLPPDLTRVALDVTSRGVANTQTTGTLQAAPGAGRRIRVWGFQAFPVNTVQAAANWRAGIYTVGDSTHIIGASGATFAAPPPAWLPGGYAIPANAVIGYAVSSALVSLVLRLIAYYTLEDV